jgi:hypothetical protein
MTSIMYDNTRLHMFATGIDTINDISDYCGYLSLQNIADLITVFKPEFVTLCTVMDDGSLMGIAEFKAEDDNNDNFIHFRFKAIGWITNFTWIDIQKIEESVRKQTRLERIKNG